MAGKSGFGAKLRRGDGTGGGFTEIANVTNISGPSTEREDIDVSAHDSPGGWMEFVGGMKDPGEVSVDINYDPSVHDVLMDDYDEDDPRRWEIVWPEGTTWRFRAFLSGFEPEAPYDDKLEASLSFKVTGKPELIPAGSEPDPGDGSGTEGL